MNINCDRKSTISLLTFSIPFLNNWKFQKIAKMNIGEIWKDPRRTQEYFKGWESPFLREHQMGILVQGVASLVMAVAILILPSMQIPLGILAATTFLNTCYSQMLQRKDLATACGLKVQTRAELHQKSEQFKHDIEKKLEENQDQEALDLIQKNEFLSHHDKTSLIDLIARSAYEKKNYAVGIQANLIGNISLTILKNLVSENNFEMALNLITTYKAQIRIRSFINYLVSKEYFDFAEQVAALDEDRYFEILKMIHTLRKIDERIKSALNLTDEEEQRVALIKDLLSFSEEDVIQKALRPGYERESVDGLEWDFLKKVESKLIEKQKYTLLAKVLVMYCRFRLPILITCLEKVLQNNGYDEAFEIVKLSKKRNLYPTLVKLICRLSDPNFEQALLAANKSGNILEALKEEILPRLVQFQKYDQAVYIVDDLSQYKRYYVQQESYLCLVQLFCNANPPQLIRAKNAFQKIYEISPKLKAAEIIKAIDPSFDH